MSSKQKICLSTVCLLLYLATTGQFTVSDNKRFLLRINAPFFYLGDTGWERFHRLNLEQADYYLKRRSEQGFTVVQAVVLAEFDRPHTPNAYGDLPLDNDDPTKPNEAYFRHSPSSGYGEDWVLILDDGAKSYTLP